MITSDYSLTKLFLNKEIRIQVNETQSFIIKIKPLKDFITDEKWNGIYHMWGFSVKKWRSLFSIDLPSSFDYIKLIILELVKYKQYADLANSFKLYLEEIIPNIEFDYRAATMSASVNGITITSEIWDYVVYLLKLTCGEKINQPLSSDSHEFFQKQQEMEEKIKEIRNKNTKQTDSDQLMKILLSISYSFPFLTFEYLFDQTMAQIHWLQKMAVGEVSYKLNAQAMAAGNMKKGKKLEFFIK